MRHKPLLTPTMRPILAALISVHQPLSIANLVELTEAVPPTVLLSIRKRRSNGIVVTGTIDGITYCEVPDVKPAAAAAVAQ